MSAIASPSYLFSGSDALLGRLSGFNPLASGGTLGFGVGLVVVTRGQRALRRG